LESQRPGFLISELEHEVRGESAGIAFHRFVEVGGFHLVQASQVAVKHDLLAADEVDSTLDQFDGRLAGGREEFLRHRYPGRMVASEG
jgi:hypothetical protein